MYNNYSFYRVIQSFEVILSTSAQQAPLNEVQKFTVPSLTILTERVSMNGSYTIILFWNNIDHVTLLLTEECDEPDKRRKEVLHRYY